MFFWVKAFPKIRNVVIKLSAKVQINIYTKE